MQSADSLRTQSAVLVDAVRLLEQVPEGRGRRRHLSGLRRTAVAGILSAAKEFRDPHTVVALQALDVARDFEDLLAENLTPAGIEVSQSELRELAIKSATEGHGASFRGLEALLEVRPIASAEGDALAKGIERAYESLARAQKLLSAAP